MQRWASDDLRSVNAQIEFVLRQSLISSGRYRATNSDPVIEGESVTSEALPDNGKSANKKP
jgi:hypothetical protein